MGGLWHPETWWLPRPAWLGMFQRNMLPIHVGQEIILSPSSSPLPPLSQPSLLHPEISFCLSASQQGFLHLSLYPAAIWAFLFCSCPSSFGLNEFLFSLFMLGELAQHGGGGSPLRTGNSRLNSSLPSGQWIKKKKKKPFILWCSSLMPKANGILSL